VRLSHQADSLQRERCYTKHNYYSDYHTDLDSVVSQATDYLLVVILEAVDTLASLRATLDTPHLALPRSPVVLDLLHRVNCNSVCMYRSGTQESPSLPN